MTISDFLELTEELETLGDNLSSNEELENFKIMKSIIKPKRGKKSYETNIN